jgi:DNA-binding winged helix-turn-helix (wHTH) protein
VVAAIHQIARQITRSIGASRAKILLTGTSTDPSGGTFGAGVGALDRGTRTVSFGPFKLDCERGELRRGGELVDLAPKPLSLLVYLALHRTRAVPKHELLDQLWPDVFVSETALSSALKDLRRAIGDDGARMQVIQTLRRRGYRFAAQVREGRLAPKPQSSVDVLAESDAPQPPAFVGRTRELAWLSERLADAANGRPRVALVVGEPGVGKSRLVEQMQHEPACQGFEVVTGRCHVEPSIPYLPFVEALSAWLLENDETSDHVLGEDATVVHQLLHPDTAAAGLVRDMERPVGARERGELFASLYRVFEQLALRRRTVLLIEDLHCADPASLDLMAHLIGSMSDAWSSGPLPLLVIATSRPARAEDRVGGALERMEAESICDRLDLGGLDLSGVRELVEGMGNPRTPASALREIAETTGGNPYFIREWLSEGGTGAARNRAARPVHDIGSTGDPLPRSAQLDVALGARIARLKESTRLVLTIAAFIGDRFGLLALGAACHLSDEATVGAVAEAVQAGLLAGERRSFRFAHPLVREVLLTATRDARRAEIHRELADVLEDLYASARGEHALEIAHHLSLAGDGIAADRLLNYARRAADQAFAVCAWHDAARFYETATRVSAALPIAEQAALHFRGGLASSHAVNSEACLRHYTQAADLFAQIGDDAGRARVLMFLLRAQLTSPSVAYGAPLDVSALEALALKLAEPQPALCALILETLSEAYWTAGDAARAESYAERALVIGNNLDDDAVCRNACMGLALARFSRLRVRDAVESWREALARARRSRDLWLASNACARIPLGLIFLGRLDEASDAASEAEQLARRAQNTMDLSLILSQKACIEVARGELGSSDESAHAALLAIQRSRYPWGGPLLVGARACAAALRGAWLEAEESLTALDARGPIFDAPTPAIQLLVASYRALIDAHRAPADVDVRVLASLLRSVRAGGGDIHLLAPLCALAESAERVAARELSAECEPLLRRAHDRGVQLSAGWVQSIPKLLAGCASAAGRADEAELWYERAISSARLARAPVELASALVGRARLSADRSRPDDLPRARADLAEAFPITIDLALLPLTREAERVFATLETR